MTKSEYQQLAEFMAPRFDRIDGRFDAIDRRFDAMDRRFDAIDNRFDASDDRFEAMDNRFVAFDDRLRRVEILGEDARHQMKIVAEGVANVDRKLEEFRLKVADNFREHRDLVRMTHQDLDHHVTSVEERLDRQAD